MHRMFNRAGRPVGLRSSRAFLQAVNVGSIKAHRALYRSLGDGFRWLTAQRSHGRGGRCRPVDGSAFLCDFPARRTLDCRSE